MMAPTMTPDLEKLFNSVSRIKLRGGLVGKVSVVLIVVVVVLGSIADLVRDVTLSLVIVVALFLLVSVALWRVINFAQKNPTAALLEGAELFKLEQQKLGMKGQPIVLASEETAPEPPMLAPTDPEVTRPDLPDASDSSGSGTS
jgi:hypothetical protein